MTVWPTSVSRDGVSIFSSLSKKEYETLSLFCQERILKQWEILIKEGDQPVAMYVLLSGLLKVSLQRNERENMLWYIHPGEIVGEMAIFDQISPWRNADVTAAEPSIILVILDSFIREVSSKHPEIYQKIFDFIKKREALNIRKIGKMKK